MWLAAFVPVISGLLLGSHSTHATPRRFRAHPRMPMPTSGSSSALPNRLATDRASLEVLLLVALPNNAEVACEEHIREMDAAEAHSGIDSRRSTVSCRRPRVSREPPRRRSSGPRGQESPTRHVSTSASKTTSTASAGQVRHRRPTNSGAC